MADTLDFENERDEGDDSIVAHYEESDGERGSLEEAEEATSDNDKDNDTATARRIDPSKTSKAHVVRNPVPKLNTERLKGPMGIQVIEKYFEGFKFHGKGHEKADLDRIMKRLEHWSYRLFPKYHFDDFLARMEQLGTKKDLQVFMKRYRLDMINPDDDAINDDADNEDDRQEESAPIDDFDLLITEQIQKQRQAEAALSVPVASTSNDDAFDQLLARSADSAPSSQVECPTTIATTALSDEIKVRIERNKQFAIQRRLERQREREGEIEREKLMEDTSANDVDFSEADDSMMRGETSASRVDDNTQSQIEATDAIIFDEPEETLSNSLRD